MHALPAVTCHWHVHCDGYSRPRNAVKGDKTMKPKARKDNLKVQNDTGELFIEDVLHANYIHLNPTSAYVWEKCNGHRDPRDIAHEMGRELGVSVSERVVSTALDKLSKAKLLIG